MNYKEISKKLNEFKTEIYRAPSGKLNVSLTSTFINNNQVKEFPPAWRAVVKDIINAIVAAGKEKEFAANNIKNIDITGAIPTDRIMLQNDAGKKYIYNPKDKSIK